MYEFVKTLKNVKEVKRIHVPLAFQIIFHILKIAAGAGDV
jgi:hypothetical protein